MTPIQRPMAVLVAGGTGFIGEGLCRRLIGEGHKVIVKTRDHAKAEYLFGAQADIVEHLSDIPLYQDVDVVVNLAGASVVGGLWTKRRKRDLLESRLATTQEIVDWIEAREMRPH